MPANHILDKEQGESEPRTISYQLVDDFEQTIIGNPVFVYYYSLIDLKEAEIKVKIDADSFWKEHGNPTFFFKMDGTDTTGGKHTYHTAAVFTERYVVENTDKDGYISITMKFENVPSGTYTVTEDKTARFELESIDGLVNAIKIESSAIYDLEKNDTASSTFTNKKTNWGNNSSTDTIFNHIRR